MERLDKIVSNAGIASRSETKAYIRAGRVKVNGNVISNEAFKVGENDTITVDGKNINTAKYRYFMLNKPAGIVSATEDKKEKTVTDILKNEGVKNLFPVGRLDKDTTGLLLITNDGETGHRLTSPNHNVDKIYEAKVKGIVDENAIKAFKEGFDFKEFSSKPAVLEILSVDKENEISFTRVTIHEGKFHQVKRMFERVNCEVTELKRLSMGKLSLDESLKEGEYRELTQEEIQMLKD